LILYLFVIREPENFLLVRVSQIFKDTDPETIQLVLNELAADVSRIFFGAR